MTGGVIELDLSELGAGVYVVELIENGELKVESVRRGVVVRE